MTIEIIELICLFLLVLVIIFVAYLINKDKAKQEQRIAIKKERLIDLMIEDLELTNKENKDIERR